MLMAAAMAGAITMWAPWPAAGASHHAGYEPVLDPADFVRDVTNPYFPLPVGRTLIYRGVKDGKSQVDRVHVTSHIKVIEGIPAVTVTDVAKHNGQLLEKTTDWYAQDRQGNVWYLGEDTAAYLRGGKVDKSGSWQAGVRDAEPGIIMKAHPQVGDAYRQEYLAGVAEDRAEVLSLTESVTVPAGSFDNCLKTKDFTDLEPNNVENKFFCPDVGQVLTVTVQGGSDREELLSIAHE